MSKAEERSKEIMQAALDYANKQLREAGVTDENCPRELAVAQASLMVSGFKAGSKWQKEQMMKDAIEAEIINWASMFTSIKVVEPERAETMIKEKFDIGDKVKLIIVKEE